MLNYQNDTWEEPRLTHRDFKSYFDATNQAMFVENRDGYIVSLNAAACELWDTPIDSLIGRHASEVLPPKMGTARIGVIRRSRHTRPDQSSIEVNVLSTPLTLGDEEAFLTTVWPAECAEETKLSLVEEPTTSAADLHDQKMAALERLSERVSHDFNNILTSIVGFSSLMQTDESLSETNREYTKQIIESARRAETFTAELLAFGHRSEPHGSQFRPAAAIAHADPKLREILGSQITLTTICEENVAAIAGSKDTLAQILCQLASNTREALDGAAEGELKIELSSDDSGGIVLSVSDDGPGMEKQIAAAAFEPFASSHSDQKMRGLGLSRVYAATRNLGGSVTLESEPGEGTRLTFTFPASPPPVAEPEPRSSLPSLSKLIPMNSAATDEQPEPKPQPAPEATPEPKPASASKRTPLPGGSETILVVEDEPMVREIVVRSLTHLGYTVHKACDGQEGLELSRELAGEIDLIFSDIVMPQLSGPEMIQRIREEKRTTPVLFTTGFTESKHLLENGGDLREGIDLLQKPYTPNVLAERVREKLDSLVS